MFKGEAKKAKQPKIRDGEADSSYAVTVTFQIETSTKLNGQIFYYKHFYFKEILLIVSLTFSVVAVGQISTDHLYALM